MFPYTEIKKNCYEIKNKFSNKIFIFFKFMKSKYILKFNKIK